MRWMYPEKKIKERASIAYKSIDNKMKKILSGLRSNVDQCCVIYPE